jgi:hypothetical protein
MPCQLPTMRGLSSHAASPTAGTPNRATRECRAEGYKIILINSNPVPAAQLAWHAGCAVLEGCERQLYEGSLERRTLFVTASRQRS